MKNAIELVSMRQILLLLVVFLCPLFSFSQEEASIQTRGISLGFGLRTFLLNDEVISNLNYRGEAFLSKIGYMTENDEQVKSLKIIYAKPKLSNAFNESQINGIFGSIDFHWTFRVKKPNGDIKWYLGPYLKAQGFFREYRYEGLTHESFTGDFLSSFGVISTFSKPISQGNDIQLSLKLPVISYVFGESRFLRDNWVFIDQLVDAQLGIAYILNQSKKANFFFAYEYNITIHNQYTRIAFVGHVFETGLKFKF